MFKVINKDTSTTPMALYSTAWKVSKYEVFAGPYSVRMQENTDQKKLRIGTFFTQRSLYFHYVSFIFLMLPYFFILPYALYSLYFHWHDNVKKTARTEIRHFLIVLHELFSVRSILVAFSSLALLKGLKLHLK